VIYLLRAELSGRLSLSKEIRNYVSIRLHL